MKGEWKLIGRGLFVAGLGAVALMLLIIAVSAGYVGRFSLAVVLIVASCCLALAFRRCVGPFLDVLDAREIEFAAQLAELRNEKTESGDPVD